MSTAPSTTARTGYVDDGFHIHDQPILGPDLLQRAATALTDVRNGIHATGTPPYATSWKPGDDPSGLAKIENPQLANRALVDALVQSDLGRIAAEITGAEMVQVWWVQGLYKPSTAGTTNSTNIGWHQDHHYWQQTWGPDSELFTAWLALSDVRAESGPMQFVPGSHRWGEVDGDFFNQNQDAIKSGVAIPEGAEWSEVTAVLPAGGVSFHDRWLLHGSNQNVSQQPRLSLAVHLRTEKSAVVDPDSELASYLDREDVCPVIFRR